VISSGDYGKAAPFYKRKTHGLMILVLLKANICRAFAEGRRFYQSLKRPR
jgi:hypothetical protein